MISILILTKNEERDLPGCLESVAWSDDIHVYDSMSTDNTVAIANDFNAHVTQRGYGNSKLDFGGDESAHRNWGLNNIRFKHSWVLQLDADERSTPELISEIKTVLVNSSHSAYRIRRRDFLMGQWLRHVQISPFYIRLFKPYKIHYERLINPVSIVDGSIGELNSYFDHFPFSKGFFHWIEKHNYYSTLESRQIMENRRGNINFSVIKALSASNFNERRYHQKEIFYRLPMRPFIKFIIVYVLKRGFLDGRAGLTYATLQSIYEYMIVLKTRELEMKQRG
jgi:glycosyltransferase involved in cell wall biosynthesis